MIDISQHSLNQDLIETANAGDHPAAAALLLAQGADPKAQRSHALLRAAIKGHVETLKLLIPVSNTRGESSEALRMAARNGRSECVQLLIPWSNPKDMNSGALGLAATHGHAECVNLLIPVSTPLIENPQALNLAMASGQAEIASIMLRHEPSLLETIRHSGRLSLFRNTAVANGHADLAALLSSLIDQDALLAEISLPDKSSSQPPRL